MGLRLASVGFAATFLAVTLVALPVAADARGSDSVFQAQDAEEGSLLYAGGWGETGSGQAQLEGPAGIALDQDGLLYVADSGNHRIQVFTSDGNLVRSWPVLVPEDPDDNGTGPHRIAAGPSGLIYVGESRYSAIRVFTNTGTLLESWVATDNADWRSGRLTYPGLAVDPTGLVYTAKWGRLWQHSASGQLLRSWESTTPGGELTSNSSAVCVGPSGTVYYFLRQSCRILAVSPTTGQMHSWVVGPGPEGPSQLGTVVMGMATDAVGRVYATDYRNNRVHIFTAAGDFIAQTGSAGQTAGQFNSPMGIAVAPSGVVYVADSGNDRIQRFVPRQATPAWITGSGVSVRYGATMRLRARAPERPWLATPNPVQIKIVSGGSTTYANKTTSGGFVDHTLRPTRRTLLYVRNAATGWSPASEWSEPIQVRVTHALSTPVPSKTTVRRGERFSIKGTLTPTHAVGTMVVLEAVHSSGRVVTSKVKVRSRTATSCTWMASGTLGMAGTWRFRAKVEGDTLHDTGSSGLSRAVLAR